MGFIDVSDLSYSIGGNVLFHDVSFRVGEGSKVALVPTAPARRRSSG